MKPSGSGSKPYNAVANAVGLGTVGRSPVVRASVRSKLASDGVIWRSFANVIWGARCGKSARRVLLGETRSSGHAYSVRGARESAALRQAPHGLPSSRLVSTILSFFRERRLLRWSEPEISRAPTVSDCSISERRFQKRTHRSDDDIDSEKFPNIFR